MIRIISQMNPVHTITISLKSILILSSHVQLDLPSFLQVFFFFCQKVLFIASPTSDSPLPPNLILFDLIIAIIFEGEYKRWYVHVRVLSSGMYRRVIR
jgi:hypothetical protein